MFNVLATHSKSLFTALLLAVVSLAAFLRLHDLAHRPMHGDEANQAVKTGILLEKGEYRYDPFEHHGPTLYYLELPILWICGVKDLELAREWQFRLLPAIAGMLTVLLIFGHRRDLPAEALFWAAAFTAISHAMVFYSRYYVQEALFVLFAQCFLLCGWRWVVQGGAAWALLAGLSAGLLHATKETCVLVFAAALAGVLAPALLHRKDAGAGEYVRNRARHLPLLAGAACLVSVVFFSSFFTWWRGPLDSVLTYAQYLQRAEGQGSSAMHDKPFLYYFQTLLYTYRTVGPRWTEAPVLLLAVLGTIAAWRGPSAVSAFPRFLSVYAWCLTLLLSLIPYKTPWNLLIFYQPLLLLAGIGAHFLLTLSTRRFVAWPLTALVLLCLAVMGRQTWLGTTVYDADVRNPYVYAHTSTALVRMSERIHELNRIQPGLRVDIVKPDGDYWPLPWYLRDLKAVGYWTAKPPPRWEAEVIVTGPELGPILEKEAPGKYFVEMYSLRPDFLLQLCIRQDLWERFIASRSAPAPAPGS